MAELLVIPLKKSSDVDLVKPLKNLIQSTYNSGETEDYSDALNELSRLRTNAIWKVFEKSSLDVLYSYYDQLVLLESKVPPHEVQVPFKWKDAFDKGSIFGGRMSLTISSMAYERVCILFNIGALQSAGAAAESLDTEESQKAAAKLLQQAAGVFAHLRANVPAAVHRDTTPDLAPDALDALHKLMLAQAQEVIAYKCMRTDVKDTMTAKVMSAAEEMFADAVRALQRDSVKQLWEREWLPSAQGKQAAFRGLAQLYQAAACRAAQRPGEEIARLQWAVELLRGAAGPAGEAAARAQRLLAQATKDNDFIYHERIPERAQLEPVPRAPVAKALPVPRTYTEPKDLFMGLVPLSVRGALGAAEARRADAVAQLVGKLRDSTQLLNSILASLNLPACLEEGASAEGGLPESIASKARAVRDAGGAAELARLMQELPDLLQRNRDILNEAERMVREEEQADDSLRQQFGARWTRTASRALTEGFRANGDKYRQIIDNAVRADNIVRDKYAAHREGIEQLSRAPEDLEAAVPRAPQAAGGAPAARQALLELMREVEALKAERDALETELKDVRVDLREEFVRAAEAGGVDEAALSAGALGAALAPLRARADASLARQDALAARLQAEHSALGAGSAPAGGARAERDAALRRLAAAHDAYQELTGNLTEGVKFYNDLTQLLVAYQNKVSDFCFARRTEKEELLKDLTQDASRPAPAPPAAPAAEAPATARKEPPARPPPPAAASALPYPSQPQGMPLPYGAPAVGYYAAPMPALYNPYATLPYPHHVRHAPPPQPYQPYQYPAPAPAPYAPPPPGYNPYPQQ